jgi:hypothetical protein
VDSQLVPTRTAPRPPWIVWLGLAVVLAAAAALSFDALRGLAIAVGIPGHFAWLLPIAVDAGAAVSCATWLGGRTTPDAARFAGRMTWSLLGVTVVGNAGQLGMHAYGVTPPWWVAALVGAIPPAVVGSTVHLIVLLVRRSEATETGGPKIQTDETAAPVRAATEALRVAPDRVIDARSDHLVIADQTTSDRTPRETSDPAADQARTTQTTPETTPDSEEAIADPDPLLDQAVRWAAEQDGPVSQRAVRARFGIGADRAKRIHEAITEESA